MILTEINMQMGTSYLVITSLLTLIALILCRRKAYRTYVFLEQKITIFFFFYLSAKTTL